MPPGGAVAVGYIKSIIHAVASDKRKEIVQARHSNEIRQVINPMIKKLLVKKNGKSNHVPITL